MKKEKWQRENNHGTGEKSEQIIRDYFADFCKNIFKNLDGIDNFSGKYYAPNWPIRDRKLKYIDIHWKKIEKVNKPIEK